MAASLTLAAGNGRLQLARSPSCSYVWESRPFFDQNDYDSAATTRFFRDGNITHKERRK
jgi:hypothetical protein